MAERLGIKPASQTSSTIMAALSLYLIILAFFIMLTTISQREGSRTEGVLSSISASFNNYTQTTIIALDAADAGAGKESEPGFDVSIESLFESAFPLARIEIFQMLDRIEITLPLDSLFETGSATIQSRHSAVFDRVAEIMEYDTPGTIHEIEATLSWADAMDGDETLTIEITDRRLLAINRIGALARHLTARGVSAAAIAIGIEQRDLDGLRLLFMTRPQDAPIADAGDSL